jgi:hypothetical protein
MRATGLILLLISFISLKAQTQVPFGVGGYGQQGAFRPGNLRNDSTDLKKNWSVSVSGGIAAGFRFFNAGNAAFIPAQIGLQLNRRLNNNLYAFAGVAVTPVYFNFNQSFNNTDPSKKYMAGPGFGANGYGIYPGIQAGVMYVNDQKTFSISGSIGISKYPVYPSNSINTQKQPFVGTRQ